MLWQSYCKLVAAPRSQPDGKFGVEDFRCLWAVYRNEQLLPEDLADMIRRVTAGPFSSCFLTPGCARGVEVVLRRRPRSPEGGHAPHSSNCSVKLARS